MPEVIYMERISQTFESVGRGFDSLRACSTEFPRSQDDTIESAFDTVARPTDGCHHETRDQRAGVQQILSPAFRFGTSERNDFRYFQFQNPGGGRPIHSLRR